VRHDGGRGLEEEVVAGEGGEVDVVHDLEGFTLQEVHAPLRLDRRPGVARRWLGAEGTEDVDMALGEAELASGKIGGPEHLDIVSQGCHLARIHEVLRSLEIGQRVLETFDGKVEFDEGEAMAPIHVFHEQREGSRLLENIV
jgi:hypothetical protein